MNKNTKFILGVVLIAFGGLWLLSSFGIKMFSFNGFYRALLFLWPLILVAIGVKMNFSKKISNIIWVMLIIAFIMCSIFFTLFETNYHHNNFFNHYNYDYDDWFGSDEFSPY